MVQDSKSHIHRSPFNPIDPDKQTVTMCCNPQCRRPLTEQEIGMTVIDKKAADWENHRYVDIILQYCIPCKKEMLEKVLPQGIKGGKQYQEDMRKITGTENV